MTSTVCVETITISGYQLRSRIFAPEETLERFVPNHTAAEATCVKTWLSREMKSPPLVDEVQRTTVPN